MLLSPGITTCIIGNFLILFITASKKLTFLFSFIVYDIVSHIERKINYFILFIYFIFNRHFYFQNVSRFKASEVGIKNPSVRT